VDTLRNVVVVPNRAIQHGPNGLFVFVIGHDNKVNVRSITVGAEGDSESQVVSGLKSGEKIVSDGQYRLTPGVLVSAKEQAPATPSNPPPAGVTGQAGGAPSGDGNLQRQARDSGTVKER
jgi:multidrug efflux system membrane fusion protein